MKKPSTKKSRHKLAVRWAAMEARRQRAKDMRYAMAREKGRKLVAQVRREKGEQQ